VLIVFARNSLFFVLYSHVTRKAMPELRFYCGLGTYADTSPKPAAKAGLPMCSHPTDSAPPGLTVGFGISVCGRIHTPN
jgi:hypothetical protein